MKKLLIVLAIVLAAAAAGGKYWYDQRASAAAPSFKTAKLIRGSLTAAVSASGTINPVASVSIGSQVSGQLKEVLVDFNSEVKAEQVIARIDPETFSYRVRQARADLDAARAQVLVQEAQVSARRADVTRAEVNLAEADRDLNRKQQLVEKNFISPAERDKANSVMRAAQEDLKSAKAMLAVALATVKNNDAVVKQREAAQANAQVDLDRTVIRSPVDGVVIKRSIEPGQTVAASLQSPELFVIAKNLRDMQVDTSIDESDIGRIRPEQKASFTVDAFPGRSFEGVVAQIRKSAQNVANVVTYTVVVTFQNSDGVLLPGMTANVRIVTDNRPDVLQIANAALRFRPTADELTRAGVDASIIAEVAGGPSNAGGSPVAGAAGAAGANASAARAGAAGVGAAGAAAAGAAASAGGVGGGGGGSGQAMREFRERLERDLTLDTAQKAKLDDIYAGLRSKFMALRDLPEDQRPKASAAVRAEMRAKIAEILTPEQKPKYEAIVAELAGRAATGGGRGRLFAMVDGKPKPIDVRVGVSDGSNTEVSARDLKDGIEIIVGRAGPGGSSATAAGSGARPATGGPPRIF